MQPDSIPGVLVARWLEMLTPDSFMVMCAFYLNPDSDLETLACRTAMSCSDVEDALDWLAGRELLTVEETQASGRVIYALAARER